MTSCRKPRSLRATEIYDPLFVQARTLAHCDRPLPLVSWSPGSSVSGCAFVVPAAVPPSAVAIRPPLSERLTETELSCLPRSTFISAAKNSMCISSPPPASSTSQGSSAFNGQPTVLMPLVPFNVTQSWGYTPSYSQPWGSSVQGWQSWGVGECQKTLGAFSKSCPPWYLCLWL